MRSSMSVAMVLAMLIGVQAPAAASEQRERMRTRPRPVAERRDVVRPDVDRLPDELRIVVDESAPLEVQAASTRPPRGNGPPNGNHSPNGEGPPGSKGPHEGHERGDRHDDSELERSGPPGVPEIVLVREAREAGRRAAARVVDTTGTREYYRVGWHRGMRRALSDPEIGRWDFEQGVRAGARDPEARRRGLEDGSAHAFDEATRLAESQAERQFRELDRDPVREPRPVTTAWVPNGVWMDPPELSDVFARNPIGRAGFLRDRASDAFHGWDYDPWRLAGCESHDEFLDVGWSDSHAALDRWLANPRHAGFWNRLEQPGERSRFALEFEAAFARALAREQAVVLERSFRYGWSDGWDYGAFIVYDFQWNRGYAEGYDRAVAGAASDAFAREFAPAYVGAYDRAFERWSRAAVPGIETVELIDGNDDGVFEPGEVILVDVRAVNFGGGSDTFALTVDGPGLTKAVAADVELTGRGAVGGVSPIRATIRADASLRATRPVRVRIGDASAEARYRVGRPLEIVDGIGLDADPIAGRAYVEVAVVNRSRRTVDGAIRAERIDGLGSPYTLVDPLAPGASRTVGFDMGGARPAELIGGAFGVRFVVESNGVVQDEIDWRAPDRASDLSSRDFARWIEALASAPTLSRRDLDDLRSLTARRLAADWREAVRGRGNPYKHDLKRGSSTTAVGELVRLRESEDRPVNDEVFDVIHEEIATRVDDLPGVHPFLRKSLRKLTRKLG